MITLTQAMLDALRKLETDGECPSQFLLGILVDKISNFDLKMAINRIPDKDKRNHVLQQLYLLYTDRIGAPKRDGT